MFLNHSTVAKLFFLAPGGLRVLGIVSWTQSWILGDGWLDT